MGQGKRIHEITVDRMKHLLIPAFIGLLLGFLAIYAWIYRDVIGGFTSEHYMAIYTLQVVLTLMFCMWRLDVHLGLGFQQEKG